MKFTKTSCVGLGEVYLFQCPGCGYSHWVRENGNPSWEVSGVETDVPTVYPSILVIGQFRCHSYVENGSIRFLRDCTHVLAGKTVPLPDFDW